MALKPDRIEFYHDIQWYMTATAERGGVVCVDTAGSGGYPGQRANVVKYLANPSGGKPMGILLHDVVDFDTNRNHENHYKAGFQARLNSKVCLDKGGEYTTNMVVAGVTVAGGEDCYLGVSGLLTNVQATGAPRVGRFLTAKDQNGYAKVHIELL